MKYFIIVVIVIVIIVYFIKATNKQLKYEAQRDGGLINIFANLEIALLEEGFFLYEDKISSLVFHNEVNRGSFLQIIVKKNFESRNSYQMQMMHILNGAIYKKTIPHIISPKITTDQYRKEVATMINEVK